MGTPSCWTVSSIYCCASRAYCARTASWVSGGLLEAVDEVEDFGDFVLGFVEVGVAQVGFDRLEIGELEDERGEVCMGGKAP